MTCPYCGMALPFVQDNAYCCVCDRLIDIDEVDG